MTALLALLSPFLPYILGGLAAVIGGGGYIWNTKRKARNEGIAEQKAKEADSYAKHLRDIQTAAGARPRGLPDSDPNNRDRP